MSDLRSQILSELEREDPDEADAFREEMQEVDDILSDSDKKFGSAAKKRKK
jgi:hypothetical protein